MGTKLPHRRTSSPRRKRSLPLEVGLNSLPQDCGRDSLTPFPKDINGKPLSCPRTLVCQGTDWMFLTRGGQQDLPAGFTALRVSLTSQPQQSHKGDLSAPKTTELLPDCRAAPRLPTTLMAKSKPASVTQQPF